MTATIRRLEAADDVSDFKAPLVFERYLKEFARQNQNRHYIGTTYIAITEDKKILGYATIAMASVPADDMPPKLRKRLPSYPVPVLRLAQLAVDDRSKGVGTGSNLLRFVLLMASEIGERVGCCGVLADAIPDAVSFYERHGFIAKDLVEGEASLKASTTAMFLPMGTIKKGSK